MPRAGNYLFLGRSHAGTWTYEAVVGSLEQRARTMTQAPVATNVWYVLRRAAATADQGQAL